MKKLNVAILILIGAQSFAQQIPQFSQYLLNQFAYNPAVAGSKDCIDLNLSHRRQWVGFEGAPNTSYGSFSTTLKQDKFGLGYKHAIGLVVLVDSYGPFIQTKLKGAYAYHLPVSKKILMSMGMFVGIEQITFNAKDLDIINPNDDAINNTQRAVIFPEITPGIFLQSDKWFVGATLQQSLGGEKEVIGTNQTKFTRHGTLLGGLNVRINKDWAVVPSSLLKISKAAPWAVDVGAIASFKNMFSFGFSYRNVDAVNGLFSIRFLNYFKVGYSYDYTLSKIQFGSSNTHEFTLNINPCGYKEEGKYACPTFN